MLRLAQRERGWTRRELAAALGRDPSNLAGRLSASRIGLPKVDVAWRLAELLGWSIDDVLGPLCAPLDRGADVVRSEWSSAAELAIGASRDEPDEIAPLRAAVAVAMESGRFSAVARRMTTALRAERIDPDVAAELHLHLAAAELHLGAPTVALTLASSVARPPAPTSGTGPGVHAPARPAAASLSAAASLIELLAALRIAEQRGQAMLRGLPAIDERPPMAPGADADGVRARGGDSALSTDPDAPKAPRRTDLPDATLQRGLGLPGPAHLLRRAALEAIAERSAPQPGLGAELLRSRSTAIARANANLRRDRRARDRFERVHPSGEAGWGREAPETQEPRAAPTHARATDAGAHDACLPASSSPHAGRSGTGRSDAGLTDPILSDPSLSDASLSDASLSDASLADAGLPGTHRAAAPPPPGSSSSHHAEASDDALDLLRIAAWQGVWSLARVLFVHEPVDGISDAFELSEPAPRAAAADPPRRRAVQSEIAALCAAIGVAARRTRDWALIERWFALERARQRRLAEASGGAGGWVLDREELLVVAGLPGRFPHLHDVVWPILEVSASVIASSEL
ncbi:MAG TPA: helix-turn-helix transcriptional regulator [Phycisphaerales bacterium]|nr:helix-turn-helix transcriptional regulator [Phycisphaerales bacterium]HMP36445.1 helix-turn-helix transcriptional regulator [Phycisphaerales bacterium]